MAKDRSHQLTLKNANEKALEKQIATLLRQRTRLEHDIDKQEQGHRLFLDSRDRLNRELERVQKEWDESTKRVAALQRNERELQASVARAWAVIDILLKYISDGR
ncbi:MAG: hypothetical protein OK454_12590 [Thaumarchaeota archaeon]|nr:hypothetical protein [Nitrososphaerota archaeon]